MAKKDKILKDITNKFNKAVEEMASEVTFQIEEAYEDTIEEFYEDYDPIYYNRTYSTYLASTGYDNPFTPLMHIGDSYFAGIGVSGSNIPYNPYVAYKNWVFNRVFYKGIHGINRADVIRINKYRARENRYIIKNIPTNMKPVPKKIMDSRFKKITKKSNLDKMFNDLMDKYLK